MAKKSRFEMQNKVEKMVYDTDRKITAGLCGQESEMREVCDYCEKRKPCRMLIPVPPYYRIYLDICATCRKRVLKDVEE